MGHRYAKLVFTEGVRDVQQAHGNRTGRAMMEEGEDYNYRLGEREANFIQARDSFYLASVSETGWPYVQHRGGPPGFMQVIDEQTIGFADFSGNRQYVSTGNLQNDNRISLFFMDYPNRTRLKLLGRARLVTAEETEILSQLEVDDYRARVERGFLIHVEAFDWNCPQHITPRYTESHIEKLMAPLIEENRILKENQAVSRNMAPQVIGEGQLELVISGVRQLTPRVRAYELRDPNGADLPAIEAGAHLQVPVQMENGEFAVRPYSICSNPARRDIYEIAVLRESDGLGGSRAIHDRYHLGLTLRCEQPKNQFQLHNDRRPAVLIAGGIGITPIKAMAQALNERANSLRLHYAGRSKQEMPFRDRLEREFGRKLTTYSSADSEHLDTEQILSNAPDDAVFYVCGPGRLIDAITQVASTLKIDSKRIRFERFSATIGQNAKPIQLELRRSGKRLKVSAEQTILDAIFEAGVDVPFSCRAGTCKTCALKVLDGEPDHRDHALTPGERGHQRLMCPCVSRATTAHLTLDV